MIRGLYASAAGMLAQDVRHDIIAQNLANVSTTGYRKQVMAFSAIVENKLSNAAVAPGNMSFSTPTTLTALPTLYTLQSRSAHDAQAGEIRTTGNRCDLAIAGDAYFTVRDEKSGQDFYTRNGAFALDPQNRLVTADKKLVSGEKGPITLKSANWEITAAGEVKVDGVVQDRLKLVTFDLNAASPSEGYSLWKSGAVSKAAASSYQVRQGALEGSNVNPIDEMIALINTTREFEANQRCLTAQDATLDRLVNDVAR